MAKRIKKGVGHVSPSIKTKAFFNIMGLMQKKGWNKADVDYWREKGWLGKARPWKK